MAKFKERRLAKELYLTGKLQKEIAVTVKVQEKTIGDWVKKYGWKKERDARFNSSTNQVAQIKELIAELTESRMSIVREMELAKANNDLEQKELLQKESSRLSAEVANYNKTLLTIDKENRISLSVYLEVMQSIFNALQKHDVNVYMKTLDFQDLHISETSLKIG